MGFAEELPKLRYGRLSEMCRRSVTRVRAPIIVPNVSQYSKSLQNRVSMAIGNYYRPIDLTMFKLAALRQLRQTGNYAGKVIETCKFMASRLKTWIKAAILGFVWLATTGFVSLFKGPKVVPTTFVSDCRAILRTIWEAIVKLWQTFLSIMSGPKRVYNRFARLCRAVYWAVFWFFHRTSAPKVVVHSRGTTSFWNEVWGTVAGTWIFHILT